jgi:opacity protein-like surface antigen
VEADLPLPNIVAWYWYSPSTRWLITSRLDWFSASIDDYSGGLWNAGIGAQFQISDNIGLGAEFSYFAIDGDVDKSD